MSVESASSSIVVDAAAIVDYLLDGGERGQWVVERLGRTRRLAAPHLIDLEVAAAARRLVLGGELSVARAADAFDDLARLRIKRYSVTGLLPRVWALRENLTPYDAAFVVLAEALRRPLLTTDQRIARAPEHAAIVETFPG